MISSSKIAKLANLPLTDEEVKDFDTKLSQTLDYITQLNEIDTTDIDPTYQTGGQKNILREDVAGLSLSQDEALKNAPKTYNGFFVVKAIWD